MRDIARSNGDYANTGILDGYFVLDSDIAYNGEFESLTNSGKLWSINETLKKPILPEIGKTRLFTVLKVYLTVADIKSTD